MIESERVGRAGRGVVQVGLDDGAVLREESVRVGAEASVSAAVCEHGCWRCQTVDLDAHEGEWSPGSESPRSDGCS